MQTEDSETEEYAMTQTVADLMTSKPVTVSRSTPVAEAAKLMASSDAGDVLVVENGKFVGIVTDRDIAVRLVAQGKDPKTPVAEIASASDLVTVTPDTPVDKAVRLVRQKSVRRLPVVSDGKPIGVISIGDLAIEKDPSSALADISAAEGNR
jgi:CBS domain-containing protein